MDVILQAFCRKEQIKSMIPSVGPLSYDETKERARECGTQERDFSYLFQQKRRVRTSVN